MESPDAPRAATMVFAVAATSATVVVLVALDPERTT